MTARAPVPGTGSDTRPTRCAKCGGRALHLDSDVVLWTHGRVARVGCRVCGWDAYVAMAAWLETRTPERRGTAAATDAEPARPRGVALGTRVALLVGLALLLSAPVPVVSAGPGSSAVKAAARGAAEKVGARATAAASGAARGAAQRVDAAALRKVLAELDAEALAKVQARFGRHIAAQRLARARAARTAFLPHEAYQDHLRRAYPSLSAAERRQVVGDHLGRPYVDRNQLDVPRTLAHERLHGLRAPGARAQLGARLDEGLTEELSARIYPGIGIRGVPTAYPAERRIASMLSARVGEDRLAAAYFRGDVVGLRRDLDRQLGAGSFDALTRLTARGRYAEAEALLKSRRP